MGWGEKRGWMLIMLRIEYSRMMTMKMWKALSERLTNFGKEEPYGFFYCMKGAIKI